MSRRCHYPDHTEMLDTHYFLSGDPPRSRPNSKEAQRLNADAIYRFFHPILVADKFGTPRDVIDMSTRTYQQTFTYLALELDPLFSFIGMQKVLKANPYGIKKTMSFETNNHIFEAAAAQFIKRINYPTHIPKTAFQAPTIPTIRPTTMEVLAFLCRVVTNIRKYPVQSDDRSSQIFLEYMRHANRAFVEHPPNADKVIEMARCQADEKVKRVVDQLRVPEIRASYDNLYEIVQNKLREEKEIRDIRSTYKKDQQIHKQYLDFLGKLKAKESKLDTDILEVNQHILKAEAREEHLARKHTDLRARIDNQPYTPAEIGTMTQEIKGIQSKKAAVDRSKAHLKSSLVRQRAENERVRECTQKTIQDIATLLDNELVKDALNLTPQENSNFIVSLSTGNTIEWYTVESRVSAWKTQLDGETTAVKHERRKLQTKQHWNRLIDKKIESIDKSIKKFHKEMCRLQNEIVFFQRDYQARCRTTDELLRTENEYRDNIKKLGGEITLMREKVNEKAKANEKYLNSSIREMADLLSDSMAVKGNMEQKTDDLREAMLERMAISNKLNKAKQAKRRLPHPLPASTKL